MTTSYFDNVVIGDTLTVIGSTSSTETVGTLTVTTSLLSTAGKIGLGTTPGTTAAINVNAASYGTVPLRFVNATVDMQTHVSTALALTGTFSSHAFRIYTNGSANWGFEEASAISTLAASRATARIVGGSTNGLAVRNSGNTRDNLRIYDNGAAWDITDGTRTGYVRLFSTSGELTAGMSLGAAQDIWLAPSPLSGGSGVKAGLAYYNQTQWYSALEVANVASGFGTLALMKSGGQVVIGGSGTPSTGTAVSNLLSVTAASGVARGMHNSATLVAAANSDVLTAKLITPTHTPGSFTGLVVQGLSVAAFSVAGFTTPGDPRGIEIGVITGTGASNAIALRIAPPTGATTNYLVAHSTAATFNVLSTGLITTATGMNATAGNVVIGGTAAGTTAANTLAFGTTTGTSPSATVDLVHLYGLDISAGHRSLAIYSEEVTNAAVATASTHRYPVTINGTQYAILLTTVLA